MDASFELKYHRLEDHHPWFVARREILHDLLKVVPRDGAILDVGCASGVLLQEIEQKGYSNLSGLDISPQAVELSKERGLKNIYLMDGADPKFPPDTFDCIIASDIFEHIDQEKTTINNWKKILKENGIIICFVPAFNFLWSRHDRANHHFRRYTRARLARLFNASGLTVIRSSYWNFFLFFPTAIIRFIQRLFPEKKDGDNLPVIKNGLARWAMIFLPHLEKYLLRYINFPVGVSTFVIAKKITKQ